MYFFNARWYDSTLGRWAHPDSIVPLASQGVQAWDRYAFVNNNPLRYTDPTGHAQACADGDEGGGCGLSGNISDKEKLEIIRKENNTVNSLPTLSSWEQPVWWDLDPQNPDYSVLTLNIGPPGLPGLTLDFILDRYGGIYGGIGLNYGKSLEIFSANFVGGFVGSPLDQTIPDQANLQESFLKKLTLNVSAGVIGGGGITWSPGAGKYIDPIAWEGGGFIPPNIGVSAVYNWKIYDLANILGRDDE